MLEHVRTKALTIQLTFITVYAAEIQTHQCYQQSSSNPWEAPTNYSIVLYTVPCNLTDHHLPPNICHVYRLSLPDDDRPMVKI